MKKEKSPDKAKRRALQTVNDLSVCSAFLLVLIKFSVDFLRKQIHIGGIRKIVVGNKQILNQFKSLQAQFLWAQFTEFRKNFLIQLFSCIFGNKPGDQLL